MVRKLLNSIKVYSDKRILAIMGLGFSSGLPLLLVFGTLNLWLKDVGVSKTVIGIFALVKTPYSFKWLWAPIVDNFKMPFFCSKMGRRRGWILFTQILLMCSIFGIASTNPETGLFGTAVFAILIAFFSASQDIVIDALRVEVLKDEEQGAGAAAITLGYRIGMIFSGAGALWIASVLSWNMTYVIMAISVVIGMLVLLFIDEPNTKEIKREKGESLVKYLKKSVVGPFADFMTQKKWGLVLLFVMLYKLSDAYMGPMVMPFYDDMGFTKVEIANITKIFGMIATIFGGIVGGVVVYRYGIIKSLFICGLLQGITNLAFAYLAMKGNDINLLMVTVSLDNIAGGMGTTALVAYLSSLCSASYTATQYALLSAFATLARDLFSATSGVLADNCSWVEFYVIVAILSIPCLVVLCLLHKITSNEFND